MRYKYHETQDFWKLIIFSVMIKKQALHKLFLITYSNQEIIRIHKFIWNSTNGSPNLGQKTRPSFSQNEENKLSITGFHRSWLQESEKRKKYLDLAWELKKVVDMKVVVIITTIRTPGMMLENMGKTAAKLETQTRTGTIEINNNTQKSSKDLGRLAVTWTPIKTTSYLRRTKIPGIFRYKQIFKSQPDDQT